MGLHKHDKKLASLQVKQTTYYHTRHTCLNSYMAPSTRLPPPNSSFTTPTSTPTFTQRDIFIPWWFCVLFLLLLFSPVASLASLKAYIIFSLGGSGGRDKTLYHKDLDYLDYHGGNFHWLFYNTFNMNDLSKPNVLNLRKLCTLEAIPNNLQSVCQV